MEILEKTGKKTAVYRACEEKGRDVYEEEMGGNEGVRQENKR